MYLVSELVYSLLKGLRTYLYRGELIHLLSTSRTSRYVSLLECFLSSPYDATTTMRPTFGRPESFDDGEGLWYTEDFEEFRQHLDVSENSGTPKSSILIGFPL